MTRSDIPLCFAANYFDRLKGLFSFKGEEVVLVIIPCKSIHTFFLYRSIHVAFFDRKGFVVASYKDVPPFRLCCERKAYGVLERWSGGKGDDTWLEVGDRIIVTTKQYRKEG